MLTNCIITGNCIDVLSQANESFADFILTDPPYLARYTDRLGRRVENDDRSDWIEPAAKEMFHALKADRYAVSFYGAWHADKFLGAFRRAGFQMRGHLVFVKRYASRTGIVESRHESAFLLSKGNPQRPRVVLPDVLQWQYTGNRFHPTQKPVAVLCKLVDAFCPIDGLVLDPFAGSGSSLVAAKRLSRKYLGIELDPAYRDVIRQRLADPWQLDTAPARAA